MRFERFIIENFKGIQKTEVKLGPSGRGSVFTLVGLNESGKTTVLEAINSFSPNNEAETLFHKDVFRKIAPKDIVPKHRKDNFSGKSTITADITLSDEDKEAISRFAQSELGLTLQIEKLGDALKVQRYFTFVDSDFRSSGSTWFIELFAKTQRGRIFRKLKGYDDNWKAVVKYIQSLFPRICYFPTFLFEFPERVYLSDASEHVAPQNQYFRQIVQDVLDSLNTGLTIEKHIVERVERVEDGQVWDFFTFWKSDRKEQIDAVMTKLANQISKTVFARWNEIFDSSFAKNIKITWGVDPEAESKAVYLSFSIQDGDSTYSIAERSMGFRWFFCFLLFTQFRKSRQDSGALFLFDEPASNLHATAQQQLLRSFSGITGEKSVLIYSTHSHYMINPAWLENAFIVKNDAIDYDQELKGNPEFLGRDTDVCVMPYRQFVSEHPDQSTYYQPILDALDYVPAGLEHQSKTVMVEGKSDFYTFTYFKNVIFDDHSDMRFIPAGGSEGLGSLISLYLGWGFRFVILLDDDKAGRKAKSRYTEEWFLAEEDAVTLADIAPDFKGKALEGLITPNGKELVRLFLDVPKVTKKDLARFFQERLVLDEKFAFDKQTEDNFSRIIEELSSRVS